MNLPIIFLLFFALLGAADKLLNNRFGLGEELDKGLTMMGSLALSMAGIYCFSIMLGQFLSTRMAGVAAWLPFDPSILITSVLAPDMGAYSIANQLSSSPAIVLFSGIILSSTLGTTISFSLPIALSNVSPHNAPALMGGIVYGIVTVPFILLISSPMINISAGDFVRNILPIIVICALLCLAIFKAKDATTKFFLFLGNLIRQISVVLFVLIAAQVFLMGEENPVEWVNPELIPEILIMIFKITIIVCGSFILSKLVLRYCMRYIMWAAGKLRINEFAVIGLLLNLVTSVSMFSIFDRMDKRGQVINAACSVTSAFVFGGQLAFVSTVESQAVLAFMIAKLVGGVVAVAIASFATRDELCPVEISE